MGWGWALGVMAMGDLGVDCVRDDPTFNFKNKFYDSENSNTLYSKDSHSCRYYELEQFNTTFSNRKFSTLS